MEEFRDAMRREAERVARRIAGPRFATVTSYDPDNYAVKVRLQPDGTETGWCPYAAGQVGNGWGQFSPPSPGDQVLVVFEDNNVGSPVVIGSIYSNPDRPVVADVGGAGQDGAGGAPAGEKWLVSQSGARVRLLADGTIEIRAKKGTEVTVNPDGSVDVHGTEIRLGAEGGPFRKLVDDRFVALFNGHVHPGTGAPTQPMVIDQHTTTITRAG